MPLLDWQGQSVALARLQLAMRHGRLHHCYIFHGPEGVGKAGIAADFVKTLLCDRPVTRPNGEVGLPLLPDDAGLRDFCGQCDACRTVAAGNHPDVNYVLREPGKSTVSVKVLNESLLERAHVKSAGGKLKAFLIPEADRIQEAGWNKLLKTLEEPPPHTLVILIAPSLEAVLPTILSRAQVIRFSPLSAEFVERLLLERHGLEPGPAAFLARYTGGSPGAALSAAKGGLYKTKREVVERLGSLKEAGVFDLADSLIAAARAEKENREESAGDDRDDADAGPGEAAEDATAPAGTGGEAVRTGLRGLLAAASAFYRDVLMFKAGTDSRSLINADQAGAVMTAAGRLSPEAVTRAIRALATADTQIAGNVLPGLALEAALGELASAR